MPIRTCMKQDQSYSRQVFYLREDNFGLNCKKNIALKIAYKIVALFTENYPSCIFDTFYIGNSIRDPLEQWFPTTAPGAQWAELG